MSHDSRSKARVRHRPIPFLATACDRKTAFWHHWIAFFLYILLLNIISSLSILLSQKLITALIWAMFPVLQRVLVIVIAAIDATFGRGAARRKSGDGHSRVVLPHCRTSRSSTDKVGYVISSNGSSASLLPFWRTLFG